MSNSIDRRTFPGIAETWIAVSDGTRGPPFFIDVKILNLICDIQLDPDVEGVNNLSLLCDLQGENPEKFINMALNCDIAFLGDLNPANTLSIICVVDATT